MIRHRMPVVLASVTLLLTGLTLSAQKYQYNVYQVDRSTGDIIFGGAPRGPERGLVLAQTLDGQRRKVFESSEGEMMGLEIAPRGGTVAVLERIFKTGVSKSEATVVLKRREGDLYGFERTRLWVLSSKGSQIGYVDQVRSFSWRPDGTQIAVVTGEYLGYDIDPKITGVWVYGLADRELQKIRNTGNHVVWARFDDSLYIWDVGAPGRATVTRYDPNIGTSESVSYHSIYFSPSGEYYFKPDGVAGLPGVFSRSGNVELAVQSRVLAGLAAFEPKVWAPDRDVLMLEGRRRSDHAIVYLLYDPAVDSAVEIQRDGVVGWGRNSRELMVGSGDEVSLRPSSDLQIK